MLAMIIPQVFLPVLREMIQSSKEFDCNKHSALVHVGSSTIFSSLFLELNVIWVLYLPD